VQIHGRAVADLLTRAAARRLIDRLEVRLSQAPYEVARTPTEVVDAAEGQVRPLPRDAYCPTLDRLHLAVMKAFDLRDCSPTTTPRRVRRGRSVSRSWFLAECSEAAAGCPQAALMVQPG
jgi:hypothetical protein